MHWEGRRWFGLGHPATSVCHVPCCCDWPERGTCVQRAVAGSPGAALFHPCRELGSSQNPCTNITELAATKLEWLTSLNTFSKKRQKEKKAKQVRADHCGVTFTTDNVVLVSMSLWPWQHLGGEIHKGILSPRGGIERLIHGWCCYVSWGSLSRITLSA